MGYTSINLPKLIIDTDKIATDGDYEAFPETTTKQPFGTFSTGMYQQQEDVVIVDEGGPGHFELPRGHRVPYSAGTSGEFPVELRIPRSEWQARIQEKEAQDSYIRSRAALQAIKCKDQNGTNFCWANAPVYCYEMARMYANLPIVYFSPGSVAGPVNGFRNTGGWGGNALKRMITNGVAPVSIYPANQVSKPSNFDEAMQQAALNKPLEWWNLRDGNLDDLISCLLLDWPVAVGLNWWSHEVSYTRALWLDGEIAIEFRNSWGMSYGTDGYGILQGSRMMPDDACVPRVPSIAL